MQHDLTELVDDLPTEALELYVMEWEGPGVGGFAGYGYPHPVWPEPSRCRCPRAALGYMDVFFRPDTPHLDFRDSAHPADRIETMALYGQLNTEALYRACKAAILARDAAVERVREEVGVG